MTKSGIRVSRDSESAGSVVALEAVFVSLDLTREVAYVACEGGPTIRWREVPTREAKLLVRMGARSEIRLRSDRWIETTPGSRPMSARRRSA